MVTTSFLACTAPRAGRPGDERPHVRATRRPRRTWRRCASAASTVIEPEEGALASRGEHGVGRLPEPRAPARRGRGAAARRQPGPGTACGSWSPPAGPASRSTRCASSATAPAAAWARARRAPPRGGAPRSPWSPPTSPCRRPPGCGASTSRPPPSSPRRCGASFADADVLLMAAAPADFRPADARRRRRSPRGQRRPRAAARADRGRPRRRSRRAAPEGQTLVGFAAEHGAEAIERAREKLERKGVDAIVFNDVSRSGDRLRLASATR